MGPLLQQHNRPGNVMDMGLMNININRTSSNEQNNTEAAAAGLQVQPTWVYVLLAHALWRTQANRLHHHQRACVPKLPVHTSLAF